MAKVLGRIEFDGEEIGGVDDFKAVSLRNEPLKGCLVEGIYLFFLLYHRGEEPVECLTIVGCKLLYKPVWDHKSC